MQRVFAYGSNMHLQDLARWLGERGLAALAPERVIPARLRDHALVWNYRSRARGGGAANVEGREGHEVRRVVLEVGETLLAAIDEKEGHPVRYDRGETPVAVETLADGRPLDAWLYRVTDSHRSASEVLPRRDYVRLLIEASELHGLGTDWTSRLESLLARAGSEP